MSRQMIPGTNAMRGTNPSRWAEFDMLPARVRWALNYAKARLGTRRALNNWVSGMSPEAVAAEELRVGEACARENMREIWPAGHPDLDECGI